MSIAAEDYTLISNKIEIGTSDSENDDEQITSTHLAILECLLRNGLALSLKGHFVDEIPDLKSLKNRLIYINLSFNNFTVR